MGTDRRLGGYVRQSRRRREQMRRLARTVAILAAVLLVAGVGAITTGLVRPAGDEIDVAEVRSLDIDDAIAGAPGGVAASPDGRSLLVVDGDARDRLRVVNSAEIAEGTVLLPGPLAGSASLARDPRGNQVLAAVEGETHLQRADVDGREIRAVAVPGDAAELFADGIAVDGVGTVYGLHDDELALYPERNATGDLERPMLTVPLGDRTAGDAQGVAVHQGEIYVGDPDGDRIVVLDRTGTVARTLNIDSGAGGSLASFAIAPSGDNTDDPSVMSVYVVDSGSPVQQASLREYSTTSSSTATASAHTSNHATLIQTVDVGDEIPSPDSAGITWMPTINRLLMADSEINEYNYYSGYNMWNLSIANPPAVTGSGNTLAWSREPTGITFDPVGNRIFTTDDDNQRIYEVLIGADNRAGTADDTIVRSFSTVPYGNTDPEDLTYDTERGWLHVADGSNKEIYSINPGPNGIFEGGADDIITHFDTSAHISDPEGISFLKDGNNSTVMVVDYRSSQLAEYDVVDGNLRRTVDISAASPSHPAGGTWAPSSTGSGRSFWVVDRGIDGASPRDGKLYELSIPPLPGGGPAAPEIVVSPTGLSFGSTLNGTAKQKTVTVSNSGTAPLTVSSITVGPTGTPFSVDASDAGGFTVAPGGAVQVEVLFSPSSSGTYLADLVINNNDADENPTTVPLSGEGVTELPPEPAEVVYERSTIGGSSGIASVSTATAVPVTAGNLYVATITSKSQEAVNGVAGMGGTWFPIDAQCGGRSQTGVSVFATTSAASSSVVTATLADSATNAAIAVVEYSGVDMSAPFGAITSLNSNGVDGGCSGGTDSAAYSVGLSADETSLVVGSVSIRHRSHQPGAGFVERVEYTQGSGGGSSGLAVSDKTAAASGPVTVDGTLSGDADWAVVAYEIRAGESSPPPPAPEIDVSPYSFDFGEVEVDDSSTTQIVVSNAGNAPLTVTSVELSGDGAEHFSIDTGAGGFSVPALGSVEIDVSFSPGTTGEFEPSMTINSNDADESSFIVPLRGEGYQHPDIAILPASIDFGEVMMGNSEVDNVVVSNTGAAVLNVTGIDPLPGGSDAFSLVDGSQQFGFQVPPGGSVSVDFRFAPQFAGGAGDRTRTFRITSDDPDEATIDVRLDGRAVLLPPGPEPDISVDPTFLSFGSVEVGQSAQDSIRVSNEGDAALEVESIAVPASAPFSIGAADAAGFTLAPGAFRDVEVTFSPGTVDSFSVDLTIDSDDPDEDLTDVPLSGDGVPVPAPEIAVSPSSVSFGPVVVGSPAAADVTVFNTGDDTLVVSTITIAGTPPEHTDEFTIDPADADGFEVAPGGSAIVTVTFTPTAETFFAADLTINSDDADESATIVPLTGDGVPPPAPEIGVTPPSVSFGAVTVGASKPSQVTVSNTGDATLTVTSVELSGPGMAEFSVDSGALGFTVAPGGSTVVDISFNPSSLGSFTADLTINSDDADEAATVVPLDGDGAEAAPVMEISPTSLSFGSVPEGGSAQDQVVVSNTGDAPLNVTSVSIAGANPGEYSVDPAVASGFSVPPGGSAPVVVTFTPSGVGSFVADMTVTSETVGAQEVPLSGEGVPPGPAEVVPGATYTGGSSGVASASTASTVVVTPGRLYVAYVATKSFKTATGVNGLGGTWFRVDAQCGGRSQTGVSVWATTGAASSSPVTVTLDGAPTNTVIAVVEYDGVDMDDPFGAVAKLNTNGVNGGCTGGSDSSSYSTGLTVSDASLVVGAVALRHRTHSPGAGFFERVEQTQGSGGSASGVAVSDLVASASGPVTVQGTMGGNVDWAVVALEIRAGNAGPPPPPAPEIEVSPTSLAFGTVLVGDSVQDEILVENTGNAPLNVDPLVLGGSDPGQFSVDSGTGGFSLPPGGSVQIDVSFSPQSEASFSATLTIGSDDADEDPIVVPLSGDGVDELPPPPAEVVAEEFYASGSSGSTSVATATPVTYTPGRLYLALVSTKGYKAVTGVSGLGGTWVSVGAQCAGRQQTGSAVFATTSASASSVVTATLAGAPTNAAIVVVEYSGADLANPFGALAKANTNGANGSCTGGSDSSSYSTGMTVADSSLVVGAVSTRHREHTPGGAMVETVEFTQGSGGSASGVAVTELAPSASGPVTLQGSFNGNVDWAVVFVEIRIGS